MTEFFGSWNNPGNDGEVEEEVETVETITTTTTKTKRKVPQKSSSTKTTTMTTPAKLFGRELSNYDEVDVDELLAKLSPDELSMLAKEVDPDDNFLPPSQRNNYDCEKDPTGPLNRKKLIEHINKQALETPDRPEVKPYVAGVVRGKKWIPPPPAERTREADEQISIDLGDEYEQALGTASQEEIIDLAGELYYNHIRLVFQWIPPAERTRETDEQISIELGDEYEQALGTASQKEIINLAAILGFHSMMNQDQYHASLLNKGQPVGLGWDGITKATKPKVYPMDPPNDTDPESTIKSVQDNDQKLTDLNWNNIKNISDEKFDKLFEALKTNTHLEVLSLVNVGLTDRAAGLLAAALEANTALRVVNVETNFISPTGVVQLVKALLTNNTVEEFRASNQRSTVLGNKIEMEITALVEQNPTLLRLGLHLEYSDARHRVASHLQRNIDRNCRLQKRASASLSLRLPRGPPPGVGAGVDSSFFNMTPPSAEPGTPTGPAPAVVPETAQASAPVAATPPQYDSSERTIPVAVEADGERFVRAERPDFNPDPHSTPAATEQEQQLEP